MTFSKKSTGIPLCVSIFFAIQFVPTIGFAQSELPALFVTDHISTSPQFGNFASVRSFTIDVETGDLTPVGTYFTNDFPYELSLSPNGRYLAVGHASALTNEDMIIFRVNSDASLTMFAVVTVLSAPFEIRWADNSTLLVLETSQSGSFLWTYDFAPDAAQPLKVTPIDDISTGPSTSFDIAQHPTRPFVYVPNSPLFSNNTLSAFLLAPDRTLSLIQTIGIPIYGLDIQITPNGRFLYLASGTGDTVQAFNIDQQSGMLSPMVFSPFPSPDGPPSHLQITPDGNYLFVFAGAEEAIRSFSISPDDGLIFDTGNSFNIGGSGIFESIEIYEDILFVTKNSSSPNPAAILRFRINPDGSFVPFGDPVFAGTRPYFMETWTPKPLLPGDVNADGIVDLLDIPAFVAALLGDPLEPGDIERADVNQDGNSNGNDMQLFVEAILFVPPTGACCSTQTQCVIATEADCFGMLFTTYLGDDSLCDDCPAIPSPTIDLVSSGGPLCNVPPLNDASFLIFGSNFATTADVVLVSNGLPDVVPTSLDIADPTFIAADFDLNGVAAGTYRIRVTNPDGQFVESLETFEVTACN